MDTRQTWWGVLLALLALAVVIVGAGAVTATVDSVTAAGQEEQVDIRSNVIVTETGDIERIEMSLIVSEGLHGEWSEEFQELGYSSVAEFIAATNVQNDEGLKAYGGTAVREDGAGVTYYMEFTEVDTEELQGFSSTSDGETVTVEMTQLDTEVPQEGIGEYVVEFTMPGEVVDTNAAEVEDDVATFRLHEEPVTEYYVQSALGPQDGTTPTQSEETTPAPTVTPTPTPTPTATPTPDVEGASFAVTIQNTTVRSSGQGTDVEATVAVTAVVENTGDEGETQTVTVTEDGVQRDSRQVTLDSGESRPVRFSWQVDAVDDERTIEVASRDDAAVTSVVPGDDGPPLPVLLLLLAALGIAGYYYTRRRRGDTAGPRDVPDDRGH